MGSPSPATSSPCSDQRLWSTLRSRVDELNEFQKQRAPRSPVPCGMESLRGKRLREDSLLLIGGLDSVASSLSQLKNTLDEAEQGVQSLANHSVIESRGVNRVEKAAEEDEPNTKKQCLPDELQKEDALADEDNRTDTRQSDPKNSEVLPADPVKGGGTLKKAKNLAISMATKASSLARELKTVKSDLGFLHERCALLDEENRRLRDGMEKGLMPDDDDLVRLQLEALLAEKSRLANENATLTRENSRLQQLVEYHQLTLQDMSESYEQVIHGICLDFSSPSEKTSTKFDHENVFAD